HLRDLAADDLDREAPGLGDLAQDRDLAALDRHRLHRHLRPEDEAAVAKQLLDLRLRLRDREAADRDRADQREVDLAVLGDARLGRQVGVLIDRDEGDAAGAGEEQDDSGDELREPRNERSHLNPFNPLSSVDVLGDEAPFESIGATSTCGAALTSEAGNVGGSETRGAGSVSDGAGGGGALPANSPRYSIFAAPRSATMSSAMSLRLRSLSRN